MSCIIDPKDKERAYNVIANYKASKNTILQLPTKANQEFTEKYFEVVNANIVNNGQDYVLSGTDTKLNARRVSQIVNNYTGKKQSTTKETAYELNRAIGLINNVLIGNYEGNTLDIEPVKELITKKFSSNIYDKLYELSKNTIDVIIKQQNDIDSTKKALIKADQIVVDNLSDIAGTINLVAQYSDGTGAIFDFITYNANQLNTKGYNNQLVPIRDGISGKRKIAAKLGIDSYAQALTNQTKIENYRQARTIPIMIIGGGKNIQTAYSVPKEFSSHLDTIHGHFEYSDSKARNEALRIKIQLKKDRETKLAQLKKGSKEHERMKLLVDELEKSIEDTMKDKGLKNLIDAVRLSLGGLKDINNLSKTDLQNYYTELKAFDKIIKEETKYILEKAEDSEQKEEFKKNIASLKDDIITYLEQIEAQFESINSQLMEDNHVLTPKILPSNSVLDNFVPLRNVGVPHLTALDRILNQQQQKTFDEVLIFNNKLTELYNEVKKQGLNIDLLKNDKGDFITRLSPEFYQEANKNNVDFINSYFELKPNARQKYAELKKNREVSLENYISPIREIDPSKAESLFKQYMEEWEEENNLEAAKTNELRSRYYQPNQEAYAKYTSEAYQKIDGTALLPLYNYLLDFNQKSKEYLDLDIKGNFYPWIRKTFLDKMREDPTQALKDEFTYLAAVRQGDTIFGDIDPSTKEVRHHIPKYFINPFRNKSGEINYSDRSQDLIKDYMLFANMVYNFKNMQAVEADIEILKVGLQLADNFEVTDALGRIVKSPTGEPIVDANNSSKIRAIEIFTTAVNKKVYGIQLDPSVTKKLGKGLTKFINTANNKNIQMRLGFKVIPAAVSAIAGKWASTNMAKKLGFDFYEAEKEFWSRDKKVTDFLIQVNPYTDNQNDLKAQLASQNVLNKVFSSHTFLIFFAQGEKWLSGTNAIMVAKRYGFDDKGKLRSLKNLPEGAKSAYDLITEGEFKQGSENYYNKLNQLREAIKEFVRKSYGTMSQDDVAAYQSNILLKSLMTFKTWMPGILQERFGATRYNESLDYLDIGTHRALVEEFYKDQSKTISEYITTTVLPKIGNLIGDLITFGYWNKNRVNEEIARYKYEQWANKNPEAAELTSFEDYMEIKRKQIGYALRDLRVIIGLLTAIFALGLEGDDDEPYYKQNIALRNTYRFLNKSLAEVGFVYTPSEFTRLLKNPLPLIGVLDQATNTLSNTADEIRDFSVGENNPRDKANQFHYSAQWINGYSGIDELLELTEQAKSKTYETR
jgi:hypothetical protein